MTDTSTTSTRRRSTRFVGGERARCGCGQPITNVGDRRGSRWVHDHSHGHNGHRPFAMTAVAR